MKRLHERLTVSAVLILACSVAAAADDVQRAMFGNTPGRNMVADAEGLPTEKSYLRDKIRQARLEKEDASAGPPAAPPPPDG